MKRPPILSPHALACSAGTDTANRRMRREGRAVWNESDYNAAVREFHRVHPTLTDAAPQCVHHEGQKLT